VRRLLLLVALVGACGSKKPAAQQPQQGSAASAPAPHDDQVDERSADEGRAGPDPTPQPMKE
jgi:hypothetical protein